MSCVMLWLFVYVLWVLVCSPKEQKNCFFPVTWNGFPSDVKLWGFIEIIKVIFGKECYTKILFS